MNEVCSEAEHEAAKADPARWAAMAYVGIQYTQGHPALVLRNCACGSTLAKECECDEGEPS